MLQGFLLRKLRVSKKINVRFNNSYYGASKSMVNAKIGFVIVFSLSTFSIYVLLKYLFVSMLKSAWIGWQFIEGFAEMPVHFHRAGEPSIIGRTSPARPAGSRFTCTGLSSGWIKSSLRWALPWTPYLLFHSAEMFFSIIFLVDLF